MVLDCNRVLGVHNAPATIRGQGGGTSDVELRGLDCLCSLYGPLS